ncbi:MAG: hypothetical protein QOI95_4113 [Acidimicrobiaceae bacterium]|jgi:uncharacterized protein (TIGR03086 family)
MDLLPTMEQVLAKADEVVDKVGPNELANATPCSEWTVRDVMNHVVGGATMFAECVESGSIADERFGQLMGGDNLGDDYKGAFHTATDRARAAFSGDGALEKIVKLPFGEMPAGIALNIAVMDVMTHAVDIARATGQKIDDDELLATALTIGRQLITEDFRTPGMFDAEQPASADASAEDKLLAFAGRKV